MLPISRKVMRLGPRLSRLEDWAAVLQQLPNGSGDQTLPPGGGLAEQLGVMEYDLNRTWQELLELNPAQQPATNADRSYERFEDALELIALMHRLIKVQSQHAMLLGLTPANIPSLSLETTDPKLALPVLAQITDQQRAMDYVRRVLWMRRPLVSKRTLVIGGGIACILLICLLGVRFFKTNNAPDESPQTATAQPTQRLAGTGATAVATLTALPTTPVQPTHQPATQPPTPSAPLVPSGSTLVSALTEVVVATASTTPTPPPVAPTHKQEPTPSRKPVEPEPKPAPPRRSFAPIVQVTFPNLPESDQKKSCVDAVVVDRRGRGIGGAIIQINNGVSSSEPKTTNADGAVEFCNLGSSKWSVVLNYVPAPLIVKEAVALIEVSGQEGQFARVVFKEV